VRTDVPGPAGDEDHEFTRSCTGVLAEKSGMNAGSGTQFEDGSG
jgi:hypothetical protein